MSQSAKFFQLYSAFNENKHHVLIPTKQTYEKIRLYLLTNEVDDSISMATQNNWKIRYSIRELENQQLLYRGEKEVVFAEELFDVLHNAHVEKTGHGGRDTMAYELKKKFGVGNQLISLYLKTCAHCELKRARVKKGLVIKPILEKDFAERYQADLVDMQSQKDGPFAWILQVQDHFTKFTHLRALQTKEAKPIIENLELIFAQFGPPRVLHTDNGREFENQHMHALCGEWNVKLAHGQPRKSSTQGSVERANQDVENIIMTWESQFQRNDWANHLHIFQLVKNNRFHRSLNKSPYEALFGRKPHSLPTWTEAIHVTEETTEEDDTAAHFSTQLFEEEPSIVGEVAVVDVEEALDVAEEVVLESEPQARELEQRQEKISSYREYVQQVQQKRADKMLQATHSRFGSVDVGSTVRIPVEPMDRGKTDPRNVLAVVVENSDGYYKLGTKHGLLPQKFVRSGFAAAQIDHIALEDVPNCSISLRGASKASSQHGGQGFKFCNCKLGCNGPRCTCKKEGRLCNSKCHGSLACSNK